MDALNKGIKIPEMLELGQASWNNQTNQLTLGIAAQINPKTKVSVVLETQGPENPQLASGLVAVVNKLRAEASVTDETPREITGWEFLNAIGSGLLGK